jgi:YHS domain-containing protein
MKRRSASRIFDPICGMRIDAEQASITLTYIGWSYAFCSDECRDQFARTPDVHVVRLAHDSEAYAGRWYPFLRQSPDSYTVSSAETAKTDQKEVGRW